MCENDEHVCPGVECIHVVDTGEGLVCSKSGIVVGTVVVASFDYLSSSSRYEVRGQFNPATSFVETVSSVAVDRHEPRNSITAADLYGECFRVVSRLLGEKPVAEGTWFDDLVDRCVTCCGMCLANGREISRNAIKNEYLCVAALYLIREGLQVQGTVVCAIDTHVQELLPSLNALPRYGFVKGKYTKATRFLLQMIDKMMLQKPLHLLRI
jgi:hypothetical protein